MDRNIVLLSFSFYSHTSLYVLVISALTISTKPKNRFGKKVLKIYAFVVFIESI